MRSRLALFGLALLPAAAAGQPADLVVRNARVLTMDPARPTAGAVAARGERISWVGADADADAHVGPTTRVIDARGRAVVPGLIETHLHATKAARAEVVQPFVQLGSVAEIRDWVRAAVRAAPPGKWVLLPRVDVTRVRERRLPTRADLDAAAPDHPAAFNWQYANRQVMVLNTAALRAAGITRETPDPPGGKVVKGPDGEPTGVLEDPRGLVARFLTPPAATEAELADTLERVLRAYNRCGITGVGDRRATPDDYRLYEVVRRRGRLTARVVVTLGLTSDGTAEGTERVIRGLPLQPGQGDDWLKVGPLKVGVDGGILYGTAWMREPYGASATGLYGLTDPGFRGALSLPPAAVAAMVRTGHRLGWQMSAHVTGDAGVDVVLDAVAAADRDAPIRGRRFNLIHGYFPNPQTARRAAELGVCVDTQPAWLYKDGDALTDALGAGRLAAFIGVREWVRAGVPVALNSDHMYGLDPDRSLNPFNPFLTIATAVTRTTEGGLELGPDQRVSREEALRMLTRDAAYLSFDEGRRGTIAVGLLADLAVLTDDYLGCPVERLKAIRAAATVVGGKVVYEADGP